MDHKWLVTFLEHRIGDKRIIRLIRKWLKVGIRENDKVQRNLRGTPQGAVISPILANVYLHYVYDLWVQQWRKKRARGDMIVVRYADDTVVGFQFERDAKAFLQNLKQRLTRFGLSIHPEKTRLISFGRFAQERCRKRGLGKPETFDFLGFTHYCGKSRKSKAFVLGRRTIKKRLRAQLREIKAELRRRLHRPIRETGEWLRRVLTGHLNYYGVPGNSKTLSSFFYHVGWLWLRALRRRSQRTRMTWERFNRRRDSYFPKVRIVHPLPWERFDAKTRGRSPVR